MGRLRSALVLAILLIPVGLVCECAIAEEAAPTIPDPPSQRSADMSLRLADANPFDWLAKWTSVSRYDMPRVSQITQARQPLRQVELFGGDRFLAECLNWGSEAATFRLLSGRNIQVPIVAIAAFSNPPTEIDLVDESFEPGSPIERDNVLTRQLDDSIAADGHRSLRLDTDRARYVQQFKPQLDSARVQFWFRVQINDADSPCAEWIFQFGDREADGRAITVRIEANRSMSVDGIASGNDRSSQSLTLSDGWHLFTALIQPERCRLIVDDAVLASFAGQNAALKGMDLHATNSKNVLWIDEFQVRKLLPAKPENRPRNRPVDSDAFWTAEGDEVFVQLHDVNRTDVVMDSFDQRQMLPWSRISGLVYRQPAQPIAQLSRTSFGAVSRLVGQPFADRPDCEPDQWYVTIRRADSKQLFVQHPLVGDMTFRWSEIRRIDTSFYGESLLLDARQFHLGNSIRADLTRQQPDGTELRGRFELQQIPVGQPYFSLDVTELEAGSPDAPIASPFLAELRAGQLVTEVFVNDQRVGNLNSLVRFKAPSHTPQRLRLPVPRELLKPGANSFAIRQRPLKLREYDDSELGNIRLEFDLNHAR